MTAAREEKRLRRMLALGAATILMLAMTTVGAAWAQNPGAGRDNILFTQQDNVRAFDINFQTGVGSGFQTGTATGKISGTTSVLFDVQLVPGDKAGQFDLSFTNTVTITDLDGDQVYFLNVGTGLFHLGDTTFVGSGGPLSGTYKVTGGTGKYEHWKTGKKFPYRAIATNPPADAFGTVYVEVYSNPVK